MEPQSEITAPVNPVTEVRNRCGLSRRQFALQTGCDLQALDRAENGIAGTLTPQIRDMLARFGVNVEVAEEQYREWRLSQARALTAA